jgi:hypothetical protein
MGNNRPLFNYLLNTTTTSLQSFELSHLNASSNLRKQLFDVLAQCVEQESKAQLARWIRDLRSTRTPQIALNATLHRPAAATAGAVVFANSRGSIIHFPRTSPASCPSAPARQPTEIPDSQPQPHAPAETHSPETEPQRPQPHLKNVAPAGGVSASPKLLLSPVVARFFPS